jgi:glycosyltransferase involved in cell wall biosynthesis
VKVLHIISGLDTGGAELFLERLALGLAGHDFNQAVVALRHVGSAGARLEHAGIPVHALHAGPNPAALRALFALRRIVRDRAPNLIQGWMYHGNLGASLARRLGGVSCPVVWNIRHSLDDWRNESTGLKVVIRLGAMMAASADRILFNSRAAVYQHVPRGYPEDKVRVIPNGFDCRRFCPDAELRQTARRQLGFDPGTTVVGLVARYNPIKGHDTFLRAARILTDAAPQVRFLLVGKDVDQRNSALRDFVARLQLDGRVVALGEREDMPALLNAMDICVSSSCAEGFPNAIGEAMACGVPCVATDVGASAELVGDTGRIVPRGTPKALAAALLDLLSSGSVERTKLGTAARERILRNYEQSAIVKQYANFYRELVLRARGNMP